MLSLPAKNILRMPTDPKSDPNGLDGRSKLLSSRPEPDNVLFWGLCTLIGTLFCLIGIGFIVSMFFDDGWPDIFSVLTGLLLETLPVAYTLVVLDTLIWQLKGKEIVTYTQEALYIRREGKLFKREWELPWDCVIDVQPYFAPWYKVIILRKEADEKLKLTYKTEMNNVCSLEFGLLLNENQQEIVIDRIKELCAKKYNTR